MWGLHDNLLQEALPMGEVTAEQRKATQEEKGLKEPKGAGVCRQGIARRGETGPTTRVTARNQLCPPAPAPRPR